MTHNRPPVVLVILIEDFQNLPSEPSNGHGLALITGDKSVAHLFSSLGRASSWLVYLPVSLSCRSNMNACCGHSTVSRDMSLAGIFMKSSSGLRDQ